MPASRPVRPRSPAKLLQQADDLRFIRDTIERAGRFTAVSGWAQVTIGGIALVTAVVASRQPDPARWLAAWIAAACVSVMLDAWAIRRKAKRMHVPLVSGPARQFALTFTPPLVAGAVLTLVLYRAGLTALMPGAWLLLFGTGVLTGGAHSVSIVPVMGISFMALGTAALLVPAAWGDTFMAAGFGGLLIVFGIIIGVRYGG